MQHTRTIGQITITVDAPDDIASALHVTAFAQPETGEDFDTIVTAAGGPDAFDRPSHMNVWTKGLDTPVRGLCLYAPKTAEPQPVQPKAPALQRLEAAQES